jgi:hypothetical protein
MTILSMPHHDSSAQRAARQWPTRALWISLVMWSFLLAICVQWFVLYIECRVTPPIRTRLVLPLHLKGDQRLYGRPFRWVGYEVGLARSDSSNEENASLRGLSLASRDTIVIGQMAFPARLYPSKAVANVLITWIGCFFLLLLARGLVVMSISNTSSADKTPTSDASKS